MNEMEQIQAVLSKIEERRRLRRGMEFLFRHLLWALAVVAATVLTFKLAPIPPEALMVALGVGLLVALAGFIRGWIKKSSLLETARWVDAREKLRDRLSTAVEFGQGERTHPWKDTLIAEAAESAKSLRPERLVSFSLPGNSRWVITLAVLCVILGIAPEYRTQAHIQQKKDQQIIQQTGRELAELMRRTLEQKPPTSEAPHKAESEIAELGDRLAAGRLGKSESLKELANLSDKLKQQSKELDRTGGFNSLEKAARAPVKGGAGASQETKKQLEALQKQMASQSGSPAAMDQLQKDLEKAKEEANALQNKTGADAAAAREKLQQTLADLAKEAKGAGVSLPSLDEAMAALAQADVENVLKDLKVAEVEMEKLQQMAKTMQDLQMRMEKLGKDLAEQLKNGQAEAAQSTLAQMMKDLADAKLTPEQLAQLAKQAADAAKPGDQYGKVGEKLKDAAKQMSQGDKGEAAESLKQASAELGKMMQDLGDAQSMLSSLEALQQAQLAIAGGQGWQNAGQGMGKGKGSGNGNPTTKGGVGTWTDENSWMYPEFADKWDNSGVDRPDTDSKGHTDRGEGALADNLVPTKVKGSMTPGGPMPSMTLRGVSIKGTSKVDLRDVSAAAQSDAQSALSQEQVPKAYRGAVRSYFDDIK